MILCGIHDVQPGAVIGALVTDPQVPDHALLRPGVKLDSAMLTSLRGRGVTQIWIEDDLTGDLDAAVAPQLNAARMEVFANLRDGLAACSRGTLATASVQECRRAVMGMVIEAIASAQYASMTDAVFAAAGQASHGSNVAYLSLLTGLHIQNYVIAEQMRLDREQARDMSVLGLAGLLHDLGKTRLPHAAAEFHGIGVEGAGGGPDIPERYREHVFIGKSMLENGKAPARVAYTVLNHHQRFDGKGWPDMGPLTGGRIEGPLAGRAIHITARVVAAANVLDNLRTDAEGSRLPPVAALSAFASPRFDGWFDPIVRRALLLRVPPFAIGTEVRLSDGRRCVVQAPNVADPCRPVVRVLDAKAKEPEIVDLHAMPGVRITHALGEEVARYLYEAPQAVASPPIEEGCAEATREITLPA